MTSGLDSIDAAVSEMAEASILEWILVKSGLLALTLGSSCKVSSHRFARGNLFIAKSCGPTDWSLDATNDNFYQRLLRLSQTTMWIDIAILSEDMNARVVCPSSKEAHFVGSLI